MVREIEYQPTLSVLNKHATVRASSHLSGSPRFYTLFTEFITALEESEFASGYLADGVLLKVTTAYWAFMGCEKDEVRAA
ncbi:hypothetical protein OIDMADRAFT_20165 [Oidiodendron maius Zn]|uniref:Uncharacterized protein n=1 Tax=Oidiodendron maius (strain Zn) TaxID=913774 RepID=A0A0C3H5C0_OIDMZ|nr:hypothetical protein OIDMADRAFT_20165 [Oidiodendron maius Zn]